MKCYFGNYYILFSVLPKITVMESSTAEWGSNSQSTGRLVIKAGFIHSSGVYLDLLVDAQLGLSILPLPLSSSLLINPSDISVLFVLKSKPIN